MLYVLNESGFSLEETALLPYAKDRDLLRIPYCVLLKVHVHSSRHLWSCIEYASAPPVCHNFG